MSHTLSTALSTIYPQADDEADGDGEPAHRARIRDDVFHRTSIGSAQSRGSSYSPAPDLRNRTAPVLVVTLLASMESS